MSTAVVRQAQKDFVVVGMLTFLLAISLQLTGLTLLNLHDEDTTTVTNRSITALKSHSKHVSVLEQLYFFFWFPYFPSVSCHSAMNCGTNSLKSTCSSNFRKGLSEGTTKPSSTSDSDSGTQTLHRRAFVWQSVRLDIEIGHISKASPFLTQTVISSSVPQLCDSHWTK